MLKVSIVTVCYNAADTIEDTIKSVSAQTHPNIEYIIVDGGSTDGTLDIIKRYRPRIAVLISEPDKGLYDAMNKGFKIATGDIIGIINADDVLADENVVATVMERMETSGADVCWGDLVYVGRDNLTKTVRYWKSSEYDEGKFEMGWHPPHPTFYARREMYERCGYFNLGFTIAADYELMLRFVKKYEAKTCYIPKVLVKMRTGGVSNRSLKNIIRANKEVYRAWKANDLTGGLLTPILKPLSKIFQYKKQT